jgi:hypothetical protein
MSAVKTVGTIEGEDVRPKSDGGNSPYAHKSSEKLRNEQQDDKNEDVHMDDATAEEEKSTQPKRTNKHVTNSEKRVNREKKRENKNNDSVRGGKKKTNNQIMGSKESPKQEH